MAMPAAPVAPALPPHFAGAPAGTAPMLAEKVKNFRSSILGAHALITQHAAGPPPGPVLAEIENHVHQFLSEERELTKRHILAQLQTGYCEYFRQLWPHHNAWWPQCVTAIGQLQAMVQ